MLAAVLIARSPMRISFAGGGTDFESYYSQQGGLVVSAAISKYFYVFISPNGDGKLEVSSSDLRTYLRYEGAEGPLGIGGDIKHAEAAFARFGVDRGYTVFMASEVAGGSGLGGSSAVAVALIKALSTLRGRPLDKQRLAEAACELEIGQLRMPIGRQDQYASAFGGVNAIEFSGKGVRVLPLDLDAGTLGRLETCTMLFFTGSSHDSSRILATQERNTRAGASGTIGALNTIKRGAERARERLLAGDPDAIGPLLHENWEAKKELAEGITNSLIDEAYATARNQGALGGKIAGAGAGGFLLLYVPPPAQPAVTDAMHRLGLLRTDFHFDFTGARVLMNNAIG